LKIIFVLVSVLKKRKFIIFVSVSISVHENITGTNDPPVGRYRLYPCATTPHQVY